MLYASYRSPIRIATPFVAHAAQNVECSVDDQTCSADTKCQVKTHDNCSKKEIEYIDKMKSKLSEERKAQIGRLEELLTRDEKNMDAALIPWIQDRLHILYHLEGIDPLAATEDSTIVDDTANPDDNSQSSTTIQSSESIRTNSKNERLITPEELAQHTTEGNQVWLSILGKVYDVTAGLSFYGPDSGSYNFYAGRDASPCFSSGKNNPEGAAEALEEWEGKKLLAVLEWSDFYAKHETYKYLGLLAGSKYYDDEGNEKEVRRIILEKAGEAKVQAEKEKEEKKKARLEKKQKLAEEREKKKKKQK